MQNDELILKNIKPDDDKFSIKRAQKYFYILFKKNLASIILTTLVIFTLTAIVSLLVTKSMLSLYDLIPPAHGDAEAIESPGMKLCSGLSVFFFLIFSMVAFFAIYQTSRAFSDYNHRNSGWMSILLPASKKEKFLGIYLLNIFVKQILYFFAVFLAICIDNIYLNTFNIDFFQTTISNLWLELPGEIPIFKDAFDIIRDIPWHIIFIVCAICQQFFATNVIFTISSKIVSHPFVIGFLFNGILNIVIFKIFNRIIFGDDARASVFAMMENFNELPGYIYTIAASICAFYLITSAGMAFLSYFWFCRRTVL